MRKCKVFRIRDEGLVEIYKDRIVVTTFRGHVVIYCKITSIEDPQRLLDECW